MSSDGILKTIVTSSTYRKEIGISFQVGFPKFSLRNNELYVTVYPHLERYHDGVIDFYLPQYIMELVYPFRRVVLLENNSCFVEEWSDVSKKPVCQVSMKNLEENKEHIEKLFSAADDLLLFRKENVKSLSLSQSVMEYERLYSATIKFMGLQKIYGGIYASYRDL